MVRIGSAIAQCPCGNHSVFCIRTERVAWDVREGVLSDDRIIRNIYPAPGVILLQLPCERCIIEDIGSSACQGLNVEVDIRVLHGFGVGVPRDFQLEGIQDRG